MAKRAASKSKSRPAGKARKATSGAARRNKPASRRTSTSRKSTARKPAQHRATGRRTAGRTARGRSGGFGLSITPALAKLAKQLSAAMAGMTAAPSDAIALLKQDHREVETLFEEFEHLESKAEKGKLAAKICLMLTVHATIEEELLYPPAHEEIEEDLVDEAMVEHACARQLIAQIEAMKPGDHLFDANVKVLGEYIRHHVKEEEGEMFPQLRSSDIDLTELGETLMQRKSELLDRMSASKR